MDGSATMMDLSRLSVEVGVTYLVSLAAINDVGTSNESNQLPYTQQENEPCKKTTH